MVTPSPAPSQMIAPAPAAPTPLPVPTKKGRTAPLWLFGLLILGGLLLAGWLVSVLGPGYLFVGMLVSLVPLAIVLISARLLDQWEPEPTGLLLAALGWGAIFATGLALLVDLGLYAALLPPDTAETEFVSAVVQAPIVEEITKGLGLLIIFFAAKRAFNGPVDGVVYAAMIGGGFAFTENILYFTGAYNSGGPLEFGFTFVVRGLMSPFAHVMFTSLTGIALGYAARRGYSAGAAVGLWALGLVGAMFLHALWNGSAYLGDFFALYVTVQVPLFILYIVGIIALRRSEARLTRRRLTEYADAGWFTPQEVSMLATGAGRRAAMNWARGLPGDRSRTMREFISDATTLALVRQRMHTGGDKAAASDQQALLARTSAERAQLLSH